MKLLRKQNHAVYYLNDEVTEEVLYGGAAGGAKSVLGCLWLIERCMRFPNTRWLMGRSKLKTLKETTLNTFFEVSSRLGISGEFNYNGQSNAITFANGSEIILKDLFLYPSDPNFDSLGSLEITGAFIDECNQITYKALQIVKSRIRYKLNEFKLIPKVLLTCNPAKNWTYTEFYKPSKSNQLEPYRRFIQSLPGDNPHLPESYIASLNRLDKASKERLLFGNWEYDDDPNSLCSYDNILSIFTNDHVAKSPQKYIVADVARFGSDAAVIGVWYGMALVEVVRFEKSSIVDLQNCITELRVKHQVPIHRCIADEDGVGGGLVDVLGIQGFVNNSKPKTNPVSGLAENYYNFQTQCAYMLASAINYFSIHIDCEISGDSRTQIIEELEQLKTYKIDSDNKLRILPKELIKANIGRSPDWRDMLLMRFAFEFEFQIGSF